MKKWEIRQLRYTFMHQCFKRDDYECVTCGFKEFEEEDVEHYLTAHHITDRHEISNGGYVIENGISLCEDCHWKAEEFHISNGKRHVNDFHPDDLYKKIGSSYEEALEASENLV